jgi:recombinational DNA repair protein RecT
MIDPTVPPIVETMSKDEVEKFAQKYSKTYNKEKNTFSGPWGSDFDSMAKKTLMLKAMKNAPIKNEFINTIVAEDEADREDGLIKAEASINAVSPSPLDEGEEEPPPHEDTPGDDESHGN